MGVLEILLNRPVMISCAIAGALIASLGPYILKKSGSHSDLIRVLVIRSGYAVSWISVALFITAGFFSDH